MLFIAIGLSMIVGMVLAVVGLVKTVKTPDCKPSGGTFVIIGIALQLWWLALVGYAAYEFFVQQQNT